MDYLDLKDPQGTEFVWRATEELEVLLGNQESKENLEYRVFLEKRVRMELQEHQEETEIQEMTEHQD